MGRHAFPIVPLAVHAARNTAEAMQLIVRWEPQFVAVAWDGEFDAEQICAAGLRIPGTAILATMTAPADAKALKAGCHALCAAAPYPTCSKRGSMWAMRRASTRC